MTYGDDLLGTAELIRLVGRGEIPLTVANSVLLGIEMTYRPGVRGTLVLAENQHLDGVRQLMGRAGRISGRIIAAGGPKPS